MFWKQDTSEVDRLDGWLPILPQGRWTEPRLQVVSLSTRKGLQK